jgi:hypothetical protein
LFRDPHQVDMLWILLFLARFRCSLYHWNTL